MKQNTKHNSIWLMLFMLIAPFLISCSSDSDDEPVSGGEYSFVEPCLDWNKSTSEVKAYMDKKQGWSLEESTSSSMVYMNKKINSSITYAFGSVGGYTGLMNATVTYFGKDKKGAASIKADVERKYQISLLEDPESSSKDVTVYGGSGNINGKRVIVLLMVNSAFVSVGFNLGL